MMRSVTIIGAGIGGLCTGISLLLRGYDVSIYEKNDTAGGVLRTVASPDGAFRFEESASIPINPNTYHQYLSELGLDPKDYFSDQKLETLYHVFFHNGKVLRVPHNLTQMRAALQKDFGQDVRGWERFLSITNRKQEISKKYFINQPFLTASSVMNIELLRKLVELNPFSSASGYVKQFITSKELRDFILFQAFFMGIAPDKLPNVYTTVYSGSQMEGISQIKGGLSHYAQLLARIFVERGGKLSVCAPVQKVMRAGAKVTGLRVGGKTVAADVVVVNADYHYAQQVLLGRKMHRYKTLSCSAFIIHLGLAKQYPMLDVHNLLIGKQFEAEIANVFEGKLPDDLSLYLYSPSLADDSFCANPSHSVVNIMVRVPNLASLPLAWDEKTKQTLTNRCLAAVSTIAGLEDLKANILYQSVTTPMDFRDRYNCQHGCCFGVGHTLLQSMVLRPQLQDKTYRNLYYVGSSIHPGNGASIVIECARMAADAICRDHPV